MIPIRKVHLTVNKFFDSITDEQLENFNISKNDTVIVSGNTIKLTLKQMYGSFEILHSDTIEDVIGYWNNFKTVYRQTFSRIYDTLSIQYEPLHNYDKTSEINVSGNATSTSNAENVNAETTENDSTFINTSKSDSTSTNSATSNNVTSEHTFGNIGVTTSMTLLEEEVRGRIENNLVKIICELYAETELI